VARNPEASELRRQKAAILGNLSIKHLIVNQMFCFIARPARDHTCQLLNKDRILAEELMHPLGNVSKIDKVVNNQVDQSHCPAADHSDDRQVG
jgi:hypothetical protein